MVSWRVTDDEDLNQSTSTALMNVLRPKPFVDADPWENPALAAQGESSIAPTFTSGAVADQSAIAPPLREWSTPLPPPPEPSFLEKALEMFVQGTGYGTTPEPNGGPGTFGGVGRVMESEIPGVTPWWRENIQQPVGNIAEALENVNPYTRNLNVAEPIAEGLVGGGTVGDFVLNAPLPGLGAVKGADEAVDVARAFAKNIDALPVPTGAVRETLAPPAVLTSTPEGTQRLYHGTGGAEADIIRREGTLPGSAFTEDPEIARLHATNRGMPDPTVLSFDVPPGGVVPQEWFYTAPERLFPSAPTAPRFVSPTEGELLPAMAGGAPLRGEDAAREAARKAAIEADPFYGLTETVRNDRPVMGARPVPEKPPKLLPKPEPAPGAAAPDLPGSPRSGPAAPPASMADAQRQALLSKGFTPEEVDTFLGSMNVKSGEQVGREAELAGENIRLSNRAGNMTAAMEGTTRTAEMPEVRTRQAEMTDKAIQGGAQRLGEEGAPPVAQQAFLDFSSQRAALLDKAPHQPNIARRGVQAFTGDVQSPFLSELIASKDELGDVVRKMPGAGSTPEQVEEAAQKAQQVFEDMMLDRKFGAGDSPAKKAAKETLQNNAAERWAAETVAAPVAKVNNLMRQLMLSFDIAGSAGQQGLRAMRGSPALASGVVSRLLQGLHIAPELYRSNDVPHAVQQMADGLILSGAKAADITGGARNPIAKGFENVTGAQFEVLSKARSLMYDGLLLQNWALNKVTKGLLGGNIGDAAVRRHIAEFANTLGSTARTTTGGKRGVAEKLFGLSPKMVRAQVNEVLTPLRAYRSGEDRLNALNLLIGTSMTIAAANELNKEFGVGDFVWNPLERGFGRITTQLKDDEGRNQIFDFMPQAALLRTIMQTVNAGLEKDPEQALQAWERFGVGRAGPVASGALRIGGGVGYDREGQFHYGNMPMDERLKASIPIPLAGRNVAQDIMQGKAPQAQDILLGQTGAGIYPESSSARRDRERETVAKRMGLESYRAATEAQQRQIDADAEVAPYVQKATEESAERGSVLSQNKLANAEDRQRAEFGEDGARSIDAKLASREIKGEEARLSFDALEEKLAIAAATRAASPEAQKEILELERNRKNLTEAEQAQLDYYAIFDKQGVKNGQGDLNFDAYQRELANWQAQWPQFTKEDVSPTRALSPVHAELKQDRQALRPYWKIEDDVWQEAKKSDPSIQKYASVRDYINAERMAFEAQGLPPEVAEKVATAQATYYTTQAKVDQMLFLLDNPELIEKLDRWGYNYPSAVKPFMPNYADKLVGAGAR